MPGIKVCRWGVPAGSWEAELQRGQQVLMNNTVSFLIQPTDMKITFFLLVLKHGVFLKENSDILFIKKINGNVEKWQISKEAGVLWVWKVKK